jgi:hypothetical protein
MNALTPKPKITINPNSEHKLGLLYHINDLVKRYGKDIIMVNLL